MQQPAIYTQTSSSQQEEDGTRLTTQLTRREAQRDTVPANSSINASITAALMRGARFIVDGVGKIEVLEPDRIPPVDRTLLRANWPAAAAEIRRREQEIRSATPYLCPECGNEVARWVGENIWLPGFHMGWGERGWANQGQAIPFISCKQCGHHWKVEYPE